MARAVAFYTEILGLRLQYRAGKIISQCSTPATSYPWVCTPRSKSAAAPAPGMPASIQVGLNVWKPLAQVVETLQSRGVRFQQHRQNPIVDDGTVKLAFFSDPDGTAQYLCETAQPLSGADPPARHRFPNLAGRSPRGKPVAVRASSSVEVLVQQFRQR